MGGGEGLPELAEGGGSARGVRAEGVAVAAGEEGEGVEGGGEGEPGGAVGFEGRGAGVEGAGAAGEVGEVEAFEAGLSDWRFEGGGGGGGAGEGLAVVHVFEEVPGLLDEVFEGVAFDFCVEFFVRGGGGRGLGEFAADGFGFFEDGEGEVVGV